MGHPRAPGAAGENPARHSVMEAYEVEHDFPGLGRRTMLLNARQVFYRSEAPARSFSSASRMSPSAAPSSARRTNCCEQKDILLQELQHRVANSLQIIASIILLKARAVQSEETRLHLQDAHQRVMSIAAVQKQLHAPGSAGRSRCALSVRAVRGPGGLDDRRRSADLVEGCRPGRHATSRQAESLGLIVTELVINALKHAFADDKTEGQIVVAYEVAGTELEACGLRQWDRQAGRRSARENPGSARASSRRSRTSSMPSSSP